LLVFISAATNQQWWQKVPPRPLLAHLFCQTRPPRRGRGEGHHATINGGDVSAVPFDFKAHPHMLRHACGFALANAGHDTRALCRRTSGTEHSAYGALHRAGAEPVQGFLAVVWATAADKGSVMIWSLIRRKGLHAIGRSHERDLMEAIKILKGMDAEEIAVSLLFAADLRNRHETLRDDLLDLGQLCQKRHKGVPFQLSQMI
jgi:hypothetical protein